MYYLAVLRKIIQPNKFNEYLTEIYNAPEIRVSKKMYELD